MSRRIEKFWSFHAFKKRPFAELNAAKETMLPKYFISPPYFDQVLGDEDQLTPCIVWAPRGGGKTAMRKMVELRAMKEMPKVLVVNYSYFWEPLQTDIDLNEQMAPKEYHLKNLIKRILLTLALRAVNKPPRTLTNGLIDTLTTLSRKYLSDTRTSEVNRVLESHQTRSRRVQEWVEKWPVAANVALQVLSAWTGGSSSPISLTDKENEEETTGQRPEEDIRILRDSVLQLGYREK